MASQRSIERRKRIAAIRDKALEVIETHGGPHYIMNAPGESLAARLGPCLVSLITGTGARGPSVDLDGRSLDSGVRLAAGLRWLSIWAPHNGRPTGKVMFLRWYGPASEEFEIVTFRRGVWEELFLGTDLT